MQIVLSEAGEFVYDALFYPCMYYKSSFCLSAGEAGRGYPLPTACHKQDPLLQMTEQEINDKYLPNIKKLHKKMGPEYQGFEYFLVAIDYSENHVFAAFTDKHPRKFGLWCVAALPLLPGEQSEQGVRFSSVIKNNENHLHSDLYFRSRWSFAGRMHIIGFSEMKYVSRFVLRTLREGFLPQQSILLYLEELLGER